MEQTLKLTGLYPVGETIENTFEQPKKQSKKEIKRIAKEEAKFAKIRNNIIQRTLNMTYDEVEGYKSFADHYKNLSAQDKMEALRRNALTAERAKGKNVTNAFITALSWALTAVTTLTVPALFWIPLTISTATTIKTLGDAYKARKGLASDATLKGGDYNNAFEEFYNQEYLPKMQIINNDRDMLLEKQKSMSKKEFNDYMTKYCEAMQNYQGQNKGEE